MENNVSYDYVENNLTDCYVIREINTPIGAVADPLRVGSSRVATCRRPTTKRRNRMNSSDVEGTTPTTNVTVTSTASKKKSEWVFLSESAGAQLQSI